MLDTFTFMSSPGLLLFYSTFVLFVSFPSYFSFSSPDPTENPFSLLFLSYLLSSSGNLLTVVALLRCQKLRVHATTAFVIRLQDATVVPITWFCRVDLRISFLISSTAFYCAFCERLSKMKPDQL